jgi:DNA-binding winged helix-turn-helix (wHTH) protein/predicted alpha/beta hydrolase family esterase
MRYKFSSCVLDTDSHILLRDGEPIKIEPQVFDLIHLLVRNAGALVTRDQIINEVWGGRIVSESSISARIFAARAAVGDSGKKQDLIKTVTRRGLQIVVPVSTDSEPKSRAISSRAYRQTVRFATSQDGSKIAYATSGGGQKVVRAGHFLTHLEMDWRSLIWRPYIDALGEDHTLVRYDQRGTGLSGRMLTNVDLDSHVADLEAVANAAEIDRFPLVALSQGVPVAIRFAALYPERVSSLIVYGGYTEGRALRDGGQSNEAADAMMTLMREGWGKPESAFMVAFTSLFCPGASQEQLSDLVKMQLASASPENAGLIRNSIDRFSVVDQLESVQAPTLVIHSRNDSVHPLSEGHKLASSIPNAELVVLDSSNHILVPSEPAWTEWAKNTREFLNRTRAEM